AEFRTPFFRSYLLNQPDLIETVLRARAPDFPKSSRISEGLRPLLGESVFLTNGKTWQRQRRIIDPAFDGGRLRDTYPAMWAAGEAMLARLTQGNQEIEQITSHVAADVIFRTLFSIPIDDQLAAQVFEKFRDYQRSQPILNLAAFLPLPRWMPRFHRRTTREAAQEIRDLIKALVNRRAAEIEAGQAPDDLATKIMTMADPQTGQTFTTDEMVDQVAIFFLAGHETSASALAWALYLVALAPEWQNRIAKEAEHLGPDFSSVSALKLSRDVFREALRLYPPVPMMVRQSTCPERFRDRDIPVGAQLVLSPWHLHRHEQVWENPDAFDPTRWQTENGKRCQREAYLPFSAGPRVCPGAGFAMIEGPLLLAMLLRRFTCDTIKGMVPEPVAHLTVRAKNGIWLNLRERP
ncbi:MAG: cytochrome P450, partial [Arenibacterium sp.]